MKQVTLVDFSDILMHGTSIGFNWNDLHDKVRPILPHPGEASTRTVDRSDLDGLHEDAVKVLESFFEKHNLKWFEVTND